MVENIKFSGISAMANVPFHYESLLSYYPFNRCYFTRTPHGKEEVPPLSTLSLNSSMSAVQGGLL